MYAILICHELGHNCRRKDLGWDVYVDIHGTFCKIVDGYHHILLGVEIYGDQKILNNDSAYNFIYGKKSIYDDLRHGKVWTYHSFYKFIVYLN